MLVRHNDDLDRWQIPAADFQLDEAASGKPAAIFDRWLKQTARTLWGVQVSEWFQYSRFELTATRAATDVPSGTVSYRLFLCATVSKLEDIAAESAWSRRTMTAARFGANDSIGLPGVLRNLSPQQWMPTCCSAHGAGNSEFILPRIYQDLATRPVSGQHALARKRRRCGHIPTGNRVLLEAGPRQPASGARPHGEARGSRQIQRTPGCLHQVLPIPTSGSG